MKNLTVVLLLFTNLCYAQDIQIDSCGLDNSPVLNEFEIEYFNQELSKALERYNFSLADKKIGFAYGNFGKEIITKKEYFDRWGRSYFTEDSYFVKQLMILEEDERLKSGGYDAIIISWSKILVTGKDRIRLIENLKNAGEKLN